MIVPAMGRADRKHSAITRAARPKILLVYQNLYPSGGDSAVAAWMLEALKDDYSLTILTWNRADLPTVDRFYGTSLSGADISWIYPNRLVRAFLKLDPDHQSIQPAAYLMRYCRKLRHEYDLVIGATMAEMDLGGPGLLYIHYPSLSRFWPAFRDCHNLSLAGQIFALLKGRTRPWMVLAGYSVDRMKQCAVLTNSLWTASLVRQNYGLPTQVVYPPATAPTRVLPWKDRENSFACVSRWDSSKRIDWVIAAIRKVREKYPDVNLHLLGIREKTGPERAYSADLVRTAEANPWIHLHEDPSREELLGMLGSIRYGIHARKDEHFGIAPAEMLMAGCIPFVHDSGGQVEIVAQDPRLCFATPEEAAGKILSVMNDAAMQRSILEALTPRKALFTTSRFVAGIREAVRSAIAAAAV